jgi:hypothetical protein
MATKKNAQEPAGEKKANGNGGKKAATERGGPRKLEQRPPVIIGGGGSTLIWIEENCELVEIDPPPASDYNPDWEMYKCYRLMRGGKDIEILYINRHDGNGPYDKKKVMSPKRHHTRFTDY